DAEGSSQHVKQFQCVPDSAIGLLDVREEVEKCQRNSDDKPTFTEDCEYSTVFSKDQFYMYTILEDQIYVQ
uniref:Uncharacterized protein n=1 Tax=Amphimedon queenslandica TaxID=400682 RepID=A0A1X7TFU3_AMPQE